MTVLRSREIVPLKTTPLKPPNTETKSKLLHPSTPAQSHEPPTSPQSPPPPPPTATPPSKLPNPNPKPSDSNPKQPLVRRRSLRLASKSPQSAEASANHLSMAEKVDGDDRVLNGEVGIDLFGVRVTAAEVAAEETEKVGVNEGGERGLRELGFSSDLGDFGGNGGEEGRKKRRMEIDINALPAESECEGEDGESEGFLSLRSGKKVGKRVGEDGGGGDGESVIDLVVLDSEDESEKSGENVVRRSSPSSRGKRKLSDAIEGVVEDSEDEVVSGENGRDRSRRRYTSEEKGKGKLVGEAALPNVGNDVEVESHVEPEVLSSVDNAGPSPFPVRENVALDEERQAVNNIVRENAPRGNQYMERFRAIARRNASRFAYFNPEEEEENHAPPPPPQTDVAEDIEDWPGPFSTAMKIIRERGAKNAQLPSKNKPPEVNWVPKKCRNRPLTKNMIPSLQDLCLSVLAKNADAIVSLEHVADALRHRLSHLLCDSRKMNSHMFELLVQGSPTEVRVRDCSWMTEEQFTKSFQQCDTSNLTVLQLDQCGRCMPDYILNSTLARSSKCLPALITLSLSGACRLSDAGLSALVSSVPALRSLNLSQCSLLSSSSIGTLADSLGSVLRELYLTDCQGIDAMLILPALKKLEHLEVLWLGGIESVCDYFIREFVTARGQSLKELALTDCGKLTDSSVKAIAESCSGLRALDLINLYKLTDSTLVYLANGCREIQTLKFCRNAFSDEAIAAFLETSGECLKELSLNNVKKVGHNTAISLAKRSRTLHTLDLSWCRDLTDETLGLIVDSCQSLRMLKLFGCTQITDTFLNGHSNPEVRIIGLKVSPILEDVKVPNPHEGPLRYSSVC